MKAERIYAQAAATMAAPKDVEGYGWCGVMPQGAPDLRGGVTRSRSEPHRCPVSR